MFYDGMSVHSVTDLFFNNLSAGQWNVCWPILVLTNTCITASSFNLVGITVVRFMSIRWPLQHRHMLTNTRLRLAIFIIWAAAFTYACGFYATPEPGKKRRSIFVK